jgi:hypothetical protein
VYFRDIIQKSIGPYIGSRTKIQKGEAIIRITKIVNDNSPSGGFVKRDERTGRWYRIKDSEARDKVGHAIRKAVQRLEDTKPAKAARLRKEFSTHATKAILKTALTSNKEEKARTTEAKRKSDEKQPAVKKRKESGAKSEPSPLTNEAGHIFPQTSYHNPNGTASQSLLLNLPVLSNSYLRILASHQGLGVGDATAHYATIASHQGLGVGDETAHYPRTTILDHRSSVSVGPPTNRAALGLASNYTGLLSQSFSRTPTGSLMSSYDHLLALSFQEQRSQNELALIRALQQQQQEENIRREIDSNSQRLLPLRSTRDPIMNVLPWRVATTGNSMLSGQLTQESQQTRLSSTPAPTLSDPSRLPALNVPYTLIKKQLGDNEKRKQLGDNEKRNKK